MDRLERKLQELCFTEIAEVILKNLLTLTTLNGLNLEVEYLKALNKVQSNYLSYLMNTHQIDYDSLIFDLMAEVKDLIIKEEKDYKISVSTSQALIKVINLLLNISN